MKTAAALMVVALLVAALTWRLPGVYRALPLLAADSVTYQTWDPMRPVMYPGLLSAVSRVSPDLGLLGPLQLLLFLASAIWLALTFRTTLGHPVVAVALGAGIMLHPQVVSYAFTALPESLLMSIVMLHAAAVMRLLSRRSLAWAIVAGLTLAAAILTKPVALSFLGGFVVLAVSLWRDRRRAWLLGAAAAAVVTPLVAASAWNHARIGVFGPQAIGGYAILGVTGTFMSDDTPVDPPPLRNALLAQVRPFRDDLSRIESLEMYYFFSSNAYHEVLDRSRAVIVDYLRAAYPDESPQQAWLRLNEIGSTVSRQSIRHSPRAYARHVLAHLYGLWLTPLVQDASRRAAFEQSMADVRSRMPELGKGVVMYRMVPPYAYWPFKALLMAALVGSVVAILAWVFQPHALGWSVAAYAGVLLHGYFLLTALAQTGLPRYALTAWPLTILAVCSVAARIDVADRRSTPMNRESFRSGKVRAADTR